MKKLYFLIFFLISSFFAFSQSTETQELKQEDTSQVKEIEGFKMYPNPVSNGNLFITTLHNKEKEIQIFDVLGKKVFSKVLQKNKHHLDISQLSSGVYILKVFENRQSVARKLVIK